MDRDLIIEKNVLDDILAMAIESRCGVLNSNTSLDKLNTIFIHPGILLPLIDTDGRRAAETGELLVAEGYGKAIREVRSRSAEPMRQQMTSDPGANFLGIHYSVGGSPNMLSKALSATEQASHERGQVLTYAPLLVEPYEFKNILRFVDLDSPYLGQIIVMVSSDNSLYRPNITAAPPEVTSHPKLHFVYPEDYGLQWDHFSILTDMRQSQDREKEKYYRAHILLLTIVGSVLGNVSSAKIESQLALLKIRFAINDQRPVNKKWVDQLGSDACYSNIIDRVILRAGP
jgi:hypothetical protein